MMCVSLGRQVLAEGRFHFSEIGLHQPVPAIYLQKGIRPFNIVLCFMGSIGPDGEIPVPPDKKGGRCNIPNGFPALSKIGPVVI
jgi:hypothetical protein